MSLEIPILMIVFNRLETTRQVFERVRSVKPRKLYIAADGPRKGKSGESIQCEEVRAIFKDIDWECEVKTLFQEENLGCHTAVPCGISWFFEQEEMGIVLEDDCLPNETFFEFCKELLLKYKDDERVMMISGDNFLPGKTFSESSYWFSKYAFIWGWASWRRAWQKFDDKMESFPEFKKEKRIRDVFGDFIQQYFWSISFENKYRGLTEGWDAKWIYSVVQNNGLCITPEKNLVTNIGFGPGATATKNSEEFRVIESKDISFPLRHPKVILSNTTFDKKVFNKIFLSAINFNGAVFSIASRLKSMFGQKR